MDEVVDNVVNTQNMPWFHRCNIHVDVIGGGSDNVVSSIEPVPKLTMRKRCSNNEGVAVNKPILITIVRSKEKAQHD